MWFLWIPGKCKNPENRKKWFSEKKIHRWVHFNKCIFRWECFGGTEIFYHSHPADQCTSYIQDPLYCLLCPCFFLKKNLDFGEIDSPPKSDFSDIFFTFFRFFQFLGNLENVINHKSNDNRKIIINMMFMLKRKVFLKNIIILCITL